MNEGRVEQIGTPLEVYEKPQTLFVAGFIGSPSMNLIPVRLDPSGNQVILGESLPLPLNNFENIVNGDSSVTLGMRPEHLEDCEAVNALMFLQVELLEKLGADTVVSPTKITAQRISAMAARPDMENLIEEFLYQSDNPLDMEEIEIPKYSWAVLKKLKETHLRAITNTSVIGITKRNGKFLSMPKGNVLITSNCKLLVIGNQRDINIARALLGNRDKPKELKFV